MNLRLWGGLLDVLVVSSMLAACAGDAVVPPPTDAGLTDGGPRDAFAVDLGEVDGGTPTDGGTADTGTPSDCVSDADCPPVDCQRVACVDGRCVATPDATTDGTSCDDGDLCTDLDECLAGRCEGTRRACALCAAPASDRWLTTFSARGAKRPVAGIAQSGGGFAFTGFADGDLWLARVSEAGAAVTDRGYGAPAQGDSGYALAEMSDGGLLLAGYSQILGPGFAWVVRADAAGEPLSTRVYWTDRTGSFHGVVPLPDGGAVLLANAGGVATLLRTDAAGEVVWERPFFDVATAYALAGLTVFEDGFAFAGNVGTGTATDVRVVRTDLDGLEIWSRTYGGSSYEDAHDIEALADGGLVVVGRGSPTFPDGSAWILRLTVAGDVLWERLHGTSGNDYYADVVPLADGFLLAGNSVGDASVVRTDSSGAIVAEQTFDLGGLEHASSVLQLASGGVVLAGDFQLRADPAAPIYGWVLRVPSLAELACLAP